jgi:UDP:flavonoid glycosyltransferase YjiC (YdhE family)
MARFLFVTWSGGGNQPPEIGTAQALQERGHEVIFAGYENQRSRFTGLGFRFTILEQAQKAYREEAPERRFAMMVNAVWACPGHLHDLRDILAREHVDAIVVDCLMLGALAAAEVSGLPVAVLVHSAPGLLAPPGGPMVGQVAANMVGPGNEVRAAAGLHAVNSLWEAYARFPTLCASIPQLDPLAAQVPQSFEFVGPVFERVPASGWRSPWRADDPRPLVLVSFSTGGAWDQSSRIRRTLEALAGSNYRVLVTTGMADVSGLRVPENAVLVPQVPHAEIMPQAAVTITHAGHGTVAASLAHGVPLVCLPNRVADQPGLAAQVAALGAGLALDGELATPDDIADAVRRVLTLRSYTTVSQQLAQTIKAAGGASTAAAALLRLAERSKPPVL